MTAPHPMTGRILLPAAFMAVLVATTSADAQADFNAPGHQRTILPESMLLSIRVEGAASPTGWILSHRNSLSGANIPDHETQSRTVVLDPETEGTGRIVWTINRTRNNRCPEKFPTSCPDHIRIIMVPNGFIAVPEEAWINEGEVLSIYIVPAGIV